MHLWKQLDLNHVHILYVTNRLDVNDLFKLLGFSLNMSESMRRSWIRRVSHLQTISPSTHNEWLSGLRWWALSGPKRMLCLLSAWLSVAKSVSANNWQLQWTEQEGRRCGPCCKEDSSPYQPHAGKTHRFRQNDHAAEQMYLSRSSRRH